VHSPDEFHFITRHWDLHHFWVGEWMPFWDNKKIIKYI
jgi:hypothetical protein